MKHLIAAVPTGLPLQVVVDASAVPNVVHMLDAFGSKRICLFDGKPGEELSDNAPHLVEVDPADANASDYLFEIISAGNGIVVVSAMPQARLKTHLKRFLRREMNGKSYYVKFYTANNFLFLVESVPGFQRFFERVDLVFVADFATSGCLQRIGLGGGIDG